MLLLFPILSVNIQCQIPGIPSPLPLDRTYDITSPKKSSITRPVLKDKANKSPAIIKDLNKEWGLKKENITKAKTFTFEPVSNQTFPAKSPRVVPGNTSSPSRRFFEKPKVGEVADEYKTCLTTPSPTEQVSNVPISSTPPNFGKRPLPTTEATVVQHAPLNFGKPHLEQLVSESTLRVIHSVMDPVEEGKSEKAQITVAETDKVCFDKLFTQFPKIKLEYLVQFTFVKNVLFIHCTSKLHYPGERAIL